MYPLLGGLKLYFKLDPIVIDTICFRCCCRLTMAFLFAFSLLLTATQFWGSPIKCITNDDREVPEDILNTFCWTQSTFSVTSAWEKKVGIDVPYPGVTKHTPGHNRVYHKYYQWVCFVLFLQGLSFYLPRFLWKSFEKRRVAELIQGLNEPITAIKEDRYEKIDLTVKYLLETHNATPVSLTMGYVLCELVLWFNVILQMYITDRFLGGRFRDYGWEVITFAWDQLHKTVPYFNPMTYVFPNLAKCSFFLYGSSGDVMKHDTMCLLPLNIFNEKIYLFLWFWYWFLFLCMSFELLYRFAVILSPKYRVWRLKSLLGPAYRRFTFTHSPPSFNSATSDEKDSDRPTVPVTIDDAQLGFIVSHCSYGDWFRLSLIAKNLDPLNLHVLLESLAAGLKARPTLNGQATPDKRKLLKMEIV